ncbi:MAG: FAD-dependent oxidoreductase, partial [Proteobacteria bacterium]|nr:FAD-dependent oxidoreductase [Pseudomonadota bacterium]
MPYYIGDVIKDEKRLIARTPEKFRETGIDVRIDTRVEEIDPKSRRVRLAGGETLPYDILVLGTGTKPRMPGIPGEEREGVFTLKKLSDALRIKAWLKNVPCRKVIIVGAGFIGMEMSDVIGGLGIETQVFHRGTLPAGRWDPEFSKAVVAELGRHQVGFVTEVEVRAVEEGKRYRLRLVTNRGEDEADMILMAVGVRPETELARQMGLPLGKSGAIRVDFSQRTPQDGVYAVGDCAESFHRVSRKWVNIPLGDIANKQGRIAGRNIGGGSAIFPGIVGSQCFKVFDLEVAATGLTERGAAESGFHPVSTLIWGNAIAGSMHSPISVNYHSSVSTSGSELSDWYVALCERLRGEGRNFLAFTNGSPEDVQFLDAIAGRLQRACGGAFTQKSASSPTELAQLVAGLGVLVGHRMHALIAGYSFAVPIFALQWDRKV